MKRNTVLCSVLIGALAIAAAAVATTSCTPYPPTQPSSTTVNQNVNVNVGNPSGSPSPGQGGSVARVGIGKFGERCPANVKPSDNGAAVRVGCTADITCSPFSASGQELFDSAIIGFAPDSFQAVSGQDNATFQQSQQNAFNGEALGKRAGTLTLACTVKGVTSQPYSLTVVP